MDLNQSVSNELQRLQSSITSLFESLANEKDKSVASIEVLVNEITSLKKENELLKKTNNAQKSQCDKCADLKQKLIVQNKRFMKIEESLDVLCKFVSEVPDSAMSPQFAKLLIKLLNELKHDTNQQRQTYEDINSLRFVSKENIKNLIQEQSKDISHKITRLGTFDLHGYLKNSNEEKNRENPEERRNGQDVRIIKVKSEIGTDTESTSSCSESRFSSINTELHTPKKVDHSDIDFIDSPFCSVPVKKGESSPILFNRLQVPASPNQLKRKANGFDSTSPGKAAEKRLHLKSPKQKTPKSPAKGSRTKFMPQLKFTNTVEAELSLGNFRKLKQTKLNIQFYKSRNKDENIVYGGSISEKDLNGEVNLDESKFSEDDLILESPKHSLDSVDESCKKFRLPEEDEEGNHSNSLTMPVVDPEETFVSSFYVSKSKKQGSEESKCITTPSKAYQRSPEYNSVPDVYKGSPVRKKAERMKLPGQMCMECNKYYEAILEEIEPGKMQEILDRCSRHRDRHYNIVQTPPGYWKPYLTATMDSTMQDDDTCLK